MRLARGWGTVPPTVTAPILQAGHARRHPTAAAWPGLKASRSASMTVKATAHTEPRGALWSIGCQPSAAESCSPTATVLCFVLEIGVWESPASISYPA